ncbi:MAG: hypothetical protein HY801_05680 [Candidatus Lindowbacteria bacterium]|nr:hypothetical protein [Candidatus Lindowbacteria bacterium]
MHKTKLVIATTIVLYCNSSIYADSHDSLSNVSQEEIAIFSVYLTHPYAEPIKPVGVNKKTISPKIVGTWTKQIEEYLLSELKGISPETVISYYENNKSLSNIPPNIRSNAQLVFEDEYSIEIVRKYTHPPGFISFSKVGFNNDRTQALMLIDQHWGISAGGRSYVLFEKEGDSWKVKTTHFTAKY